MNTDKLRSKRIIIPALAVVAVLGAGGLTWAATADNVGGSERDRVAAAAVEAAGGGTATDVETSDDRGEAYEVEVRKEDGTEVEITLDENLTVLTRERDDDRHDDRDHAGDDRGHADRDHDGHNDGDQRALSADEQKSAADAARAAVGGGTVVRVEASDDAPEAYEVDVIDPEKVRWDVELDARFAVISKKIDD